MKPFGQDWLNNWEAEKEKREQGRVVRSEVATDRTRIKDIIMSELSTILASRYAGELADRIAARLTSG